MNSMTSWGDSLVGGVGGWVWGGDEAKIPTLSTTRKKMNSILSCWDSLEGGGVRRGEGGNDIDHQGKAGFGGPGMGGEDMRITLATGKKVNPTISWRDSHEGWVGLDVFCGVCGSTILHSLCRPLHRCNASTAQSKEHQNNCLQVYSALTLAASLQTPCPSPLPASRSSQSVGPPRGRGTHGGEHHTGRV